VKMYEKVNMGMCVGSIVLAMYGALVLLTYWSVCWLVPVVPGVNVRSPV